MSDTLLTYIWLSLEHFNASLTKQEPFLKSLLPIITALIGVFIGFFMTTIKEVYNKRKSDEMYKKLFLDEIEIIKLDMTEILPKLYSFLDATIIDRKLISFSFYAPKISKLGYEEFYPKSVHLFHVEQKKIIRSIYSDIGLINNHIDMYDLAIVGVKSTEENILKVVSFSTDCLAIFMSCQKLLSGDSNKKISATDVLESLGIKSSYHDKLVEPSAAENHAVDKKTT